MSLIEWQDEYAIGIPSVDFEHRELIQLINETYACLQNADSETIVLESLGEIYAKISAHFALEEKIMRERDYDQYQDHKDDHERLLDDSRDIMDSYEDGSYFDQDSFGQRLRDWFGAHFKSKDARLHKYLGD